MRPGAEQEVEFWRQRIREATLVSRDDPRRAALGFRGAAEQLRIVKNSLRILDEWVKPGDRVMEIGCGCGDLFPLLAEEVAYVGYDLVPDFIEEAVTCYGHRFGCRDVADLDWLARLETDSRDVVIGRNVIGSFDPLGAAGWEAVKRELLRIGRELVLWSYHQDRPEVWARSLVGGDYVCLVQEARDERR